MGPGDYIKTLLLLLLLFHLTFAPLLRMKGFAENYLKIVPLAHRMNR
ncbi:hypothetical protein SAMN05216563_101148 [Phytobacter palmae]|nr:hypothetical protein SAMN05216563_101148 [Phytobacter palmae]